MLEITHWSLLLTGLVGAFDPKFRANTICRAGFASFLARTVEFADGELQWSLPASTFIHKTTCSSLVFRYSNLIILENMQKKCGKTIALYIGVRVSTGTNLFKHLKMLIVTDILWTIVSICTFHLRFSSL